MFYAKEVWEWLTGKVADKEDLSYLDEICFQSFLIERSKSIVVSF